MRVISDTFSLKFKLHPLSFHFIFSIQKEKDFFLFRKRYRIIYVVFILTRNCNIIIEVCHLTSISTLLLEEEITIFPVNYFNTYTFRQTKHSASFESKTNSVQGKLRGIMKLERQGKCDQNSLHLQSVHKIYLFLFLYSSIPCHFRLFVVQNFQVRLLQFIKKIKKILSHRISYSLILLGKNLVYAVQ